MDGLAPAFLHEDGLVTYGKAPSGILYVEDFDAPEHVTVPAEPEISPPAITEADLAAARAEGHAAGLAAALQEQAAIEASLRTAALTAIGDALGAARTDAARVAQSMAEELAATMLALLQAALPATAAALARQEITALIAALLPGLKREANASIHVHPALLGDIADDLQKLWPGHGGRLTVMPDSALAMSDVRVTWEDGEARRDTRALWQNLQAALAAYRLPALDTLLEPSDGE
ncbi:MAG TPA: FliH/SctL family protein [Acetobacteraceae bacterium]|nr:FliH/SctL family protein [Acetobacteraceae bacterium]